MVSSRFGSLGRFPRLQAALVTAAVAMVLTTAGLSAAIADNRDVPPMPVDWRSSEQRDHPLVGKIWSRAAGALVSAQDYGMALAKSRFILLGENHDNADHHELQAWAIRTIAKLRGARIVEGAPQADTIAMEMLSPEQQPTLDRFYGRNAKVPRQRDSADFGRMLKWETLGWPDYKLYEPIVAAALDARLVIVPANPSRDETRRIGREGLGAIDAAEAGRLAIDRPLPAGDQEALLVEIAKSHCDMLPAAALGNMTLVQRLRDARMADAMLEAGTYKGSILIAGNGHVREDRGVPRYMTGRGIAEGEITSVMHVEVSGERTNLDDYVAGEARPAADYIVFTPRQPRADSCEEMRRQVGEMKARKGG